MFYSHEVLTSRQYGVATVWLVATLGSKSNLKKINRKAILDVDIAKACRTITQPEVPMALRLQSNLLYGVSRVYSQQCLYVLVDAQAAQTNMKTLLSVVRTSELDPDAGKTRPDQLILQDDPTFLPDIDLPSLDLDLALFENSTEGSTNRSSIMSAHSHKSSQSSNKGREGPLPGLILPSSGSGNNDAMEGFELQRSNTGSIQNDTVLPVMFQEEEGFLPDVDFNFDADGNMIELRVQSRPVNETGQGATEEWNESAVTKRVPQESEEGLLVGQQRGSMGLDLAVLGDDYDVLGPAEPFPDIAAKAQESTSFHISSEDVREQEEELSESVEAAQNRKVRLAKTLPVDQNTELRNSELAQWSDNYVANMIEATRQKLQHKLPAQARKNAAAWVFGNGICGVGVISTSPNIRHPLEIFAGHLLLQALTGSSKTLASRKRSRSSEESPSSEEEGRRIRPRSAEEEIGRGEDLGLDHGDIQPLFPDDSIELGRDAPPPLLEDFSSQMPWNISASIHGSRPDSTARIRGIGSSIGGIPTSAGAPSSLLPSAFGIPGSLDYRARRLTSASPLLGRGLQGRSSLELLNNDNEDQVLGSGLYLDDPALEDFQLHGPPAAVNTQTAAQSGWITKVLDQESTNFFDFVKTQLTDITGVKSSNEDEFASTIEPMRTSITFHELLPPRQHTKIVAAQAFLHVLALATKGLLIVEQHEGYGPIDMTIG